MRIAYLISQYPAINHTYILSEIAALREHGFDIETLSILPPDRPLSALGEPEKQEHARTFYVKRRSLPGALRDHSETFLAHPGSWFRTLLFALSLSRLTPTEIPRWLLFFTQAVIAGRYLQASGIHRLHTHYASSVGLLIARLFPIAVSHTIHGSAEFENPELFRLREKVRYATLVCAISHYGKSQLLRFSPPEDWSKVEVAPLGINPEKFPFLYHPPHRPLELLTVGQLAPAKGQHLMLEAIHLLASKGKLVHLRLIGDGPLRQSLSERAAHLGLTEQVTFEGYRSNEDLPAFHAQADVFLLSSFAEGVPVALMEAMAAGLPCIAPRITGIPELIEHGTTGLLVTPAHIEDLAHAIELLHDDELLRNRLAHAARQKILDSYDIRPNTARLAALFTPTSGNPTGSQSIPDNRR